MTSEEMEKAILSEIDADPEAFSETSVCTIDPNTRVITVPASLSVFGTESDEKTNRIPFRCPRVVGDNVDLSNFQICINFRNANSEKDRYIVEDMMIDGDEITFSWSLSRKVTKYKGKVSFIVCALNAREGTIVNEWNTTLAFGTVLEGLEADEVNPDEEEKDIILQLLAMVDAKSNKALEEIEAAKNEAVKEVQSYGGVLIDRNLENEGQAADAKVTGDRITQLRGDIVDGLYRSMFEYNGTYTLNNACMEEDAYDSNIFHMKKNSEYVIIYIPMEQDVYIIGNASLILGIDYFTEVINENISLTKTPIETKGFLKISKNEDRYAWLWCKKTELPSLLISDSRKVKIKNTLWTNGAIGASGEIVQDSSMVGKVTSLPYKKGTRILCEIPSYCRARVFINGVRKDIYDMPLFEYVLPDDNAVMYIVKKDRTEFTDFDTECNFYTIHRCSNEFDAIVASSTSTNEEKANADYVCDGVHDEYEINCAINCNMSCGNSAKVLLLSGDYNVQFSEYNSWEVTDKPSKYTNGCGAIITRESLLENTYYDAEIIGKYRANDSIHGRTKIIVSNEVLDVMESDKEYHVFTAMRKGDDPYGYIYGKIKNHYKNIYVYIDGHDKNVVAYDGTANNAFTLENCRARTDIGNVNQNFDLVKIASGLIGIRGDTGQDSGTQQYIKNTIVSGFNVGLDMTGEHFVVEQLGLVICKIGLMMHGTEVFGLSGHTSIFNNITIERCDRVIYLDSGNDQEESVWSPNGLNIFINGCATETSWDVNGVTCRMKPIFEKLKNSYTGIIIMEWDIDEQMFDTESSVGNSCGQVKLIKSIFPRMLYGAIGYRTIPDATKQQAGTEIYDPQNKCMLVATSKGWIKPDGTIVDG